MRVDIRILNRKDMGQLLATFFVYKQELGPKRQELIQKEIWGNGQILEYLPSIDDVSEICLIEQAKPNASVGSRMLRAKVLPGNCTWFVVDIGEVRRSRKIVEDRTVMTWLCQAENDLRFKYIGSAFTDKELDEVEDAITTIRTAVPAAPFQVVSDVVMHTAFGRALQRYGLEG